MFAEVWVFASNKEQAQASQLHIVATPFYSEVVSLLSMDVKKWSTELEPAELYTQGKGKKFPLGLRYCSVCEA